MKKRTGCLGIIIFILLLFAVFLFWPASDDNEALILSDSFDNNDNEWDLQDSARIENGELLIPGNGEAIAIPSSISLKNGSIDIDLSYREGDRGSAFGVMFRNPDENDSFDLFLIDSRSNFILRYNGSTDTSGTSGYILKDSTNSLKVELYGKLLRISANGNKVAEAYEENPSIGNLAIFSGGDSEVAFDNLKVVDFNKLPPNISGVVYYDNEKLSGAPVTACRIVDEKSLKTIIIDKTMTDGNGEYSFYLPEDSSYFVESKIENEKVSSDRYTDLRIPDSGLDLDIHLISEGK